MDGGEEASADSIAASWLTIRAPCAAMCTGVGLAHAPPGLPAGADAHVVGKEEGSQEEVGAELGPSSKGEIDRDKQAKEPSDDGNEGACTASTAGSSSSVQSIMMKRWDYEERDSVRGHRNAGGRERAG